MRRKVECQSYSENSEQPIRALFCLFKRLYTNNTPELSYLISIGSTQSLHSVVHVISIKTFIDNHSSFPSIAFCYKLKYMICTFTQL